jgi:hypothetical protein
MQYWNSREISREFIESIQIFKDKFNVELNDENIDMFENLINNILDKRVYKFIRKLFKNPDLIYVEDIEILRRVKERFRGMNFDQSFFDAENMERYRDSFNKSLKRIKKKTRIMLREISRKLLGSSFCVVNFIYKDIEAHIELKEELLNNVIFRYTHFTLIKFYEIWKKCQNKTFKMFFEVYYQRVYVVEKEFDVYMKSKKRRIEDCDDEMRKRLRADEEDL